MLNEYKGPSNCRELLPRLLGEKVCAAFVAPNNGSNHLWLVFESRDALCICSVGGGEPCYWRELPEAVERVVARRREEIAALEAQLSDMAGVKLAARGADKERDDG